VHDSSVSSDTTSAAVHVELDSRPECLTVVRAVLAGVAESVGLDAESLDDVKTAVSEACNNVVLHAYGDAPGPLSVGLVLGPDGFQAIVRDSGAGIRFIAPSEERMGVGLAVISALADRAEFLSGPDGGTEVRMSFVRDGRDPDALELSHDAFGRDGLGVLIAGDVVVTLAPVALLAAVLGRVARSLAAGARFSLDRFSDLYLVTDAIAAHAQCSPGGAGARFAVSAADRRLDLAVGPLRTGSCAELEADFAAQCSRSPLALLADELGVEPAGEWELLRVALIDSRR
jgi:anti-sigma regulatory factor (Ser/Thr protein kinase)